MTDEYSTIRSMFYYYVKENHLENIVKNLQESELNELLNILNEDLCSLEFEIKTRNSSYDNLIENFSKQIKKRLPESKLSKKIVKICISDFNEGYKDIISHVCKDLTGLSSVFKPNVSFDIILSDNLVINEYLVNINSHGRMKIKGGINRRNLRIIFDNKIKITYLRRKDLILEKLSELRKND